VGLRECRDVGLVHPDHVSLFVDHGAEALQCLVIVVFADTRVVPIVPAVDTAAEVPPIDIAVREQRAPMMTTPIHHSDLIVEADYDEIYVRHERISGLSVAELAPDSDSCIGSVHGREIHARLPRGCWKRTAVGGCSPYTRLLQHPIPTRACATRLGRQHAVARD
jgi:hypothetical protein